MLKLLSVRSKFYSNKISNFTSHSADSHNIWRQLPSKRHDYFRQIGIQEYLYSCPSTSPSLELYLPLYRSAPLTLAHVLSLFLVAPRAVDNILPILVEAIKRRAAKNYKRKSNSYRLQTRQSKRHEVSINTNSIDVQ